MFYTVGAFSVLLCNVTVIVFKAIVTCICHGYFIICFSSFIITSSN
jgi:hypothetical protein